MHPPVVPVGGPQLNYAASPLEVMLNVTINGFEPEASVGLVEALKAPVVLVLGPFEHTSDSPDPPLPLLRHTPSRRLC